MVLIGVLGLNADSALSRLARTVADGGEVPDLAAERVFSGVTQMGQLALAGTLVTAVAFISWFYQAYKNAGAASAEPLNHDVRWAIGAWFVPFLNLVRPYSMMREMISRSGGGSGLQSLSKWWWGLLIGSGILGRAAGGMLQNATEPGQVASAAGALMVSDMLWVAAAVLAYRLVGQVTGLPGQAPTHGFAASHSGFGSGQVAQGE